MINQILEKAKQGTLLNLDEAVELLNIDNNSEEFYRLISTANYRTRTEFNNKGYVFAQIGINAEPCSKNCAFCSLGEAHYTLKERFRKDKEQILNEIKNIVQYEIDDVFLMTTADYPMDKYIEIAREVKKLLPEDVRLVANVGDFDNDFANKLKETGFDAVYHIVRLNEGIDTPISPDTRVSTLDAIKKSGLNFYYCVEPIGPEHTYEQIATEMLRARDYNVDVMAVMRRIPVKGTPLGDKEAISAIELTKIAAVARLVSQPQRAMNAHEPTQMTLLAGVNQLYAESGANPRDTEHLTEKNRGFSVLDAKNMLKEAGYKPKK